MKTLTMLASQPYAQALAWALLHFLWQGAILALGAMAIFRLFRGSASARYLTGIVTLAAMLTAPVATTVWMVAHTDVARAPAAAAVGSDAAPLVSSPAKTNAVTPAAPVARAARALPLTELVLLVWTVGVVALSVRLLGGWITARRVARRVMQPAAPEIQAMVGRLASRLSLRRIVTIVESASVRVPIMIGWLKPVVILPAAVASGFTPDQIEALIVHELAHVRRHDYLVNLLQTMVETALFYHPAVWWVSRRVRAEREHCCDDVAVTICDRLVYARALSDLAEMAAPHLAMAASNGSLVERVRRILGRPAAEAGSGAGWLPVFLILTLAAPVLSAPFTPKPQVPATVATTPAPAAAPVPATSVAVAVPIMPTIAPQAPVAGAPQPVVTSSTQIVLHPEQLRDQEVALLKAKLQELENAQAALDKKRSDLEIQKNEAQSRAQIEQMQTQLASVADQLLRARKLEQAGLGPDPSVRDLEAVLQKLRLELQSVQATREYDMASSQLEAQAASYKRDYDRLLREYQMVAAMRDGRADVYANSIAITDDAEAITDPAAQIANDDILMVEISGEPDLPQAYHVQSDGTIRLPLLPAIKVTGLTAAQAREAIVKQLTEHHLVATPQVSVHLLRRPR